MSNKLIKSGAKWILVIVLFIALQIVFLWKGTEIPNPSGWDSSVKRYYNAITGFITISDAETGAAIFSTYDDQFLYPAQIEKVNEKEWRVTFKNRQE